MQYNEIYNICQPVMDWLKEQYPNGHKILIDTNSAELIEHGKLMVLDKDLKEMFKPNIVNNEEPEVCNCSECSCDRQKDDKPDSQDYENTIDKLKTEVEKYKKAFEDAKKECDCQIAECKNKHKKEIGELIAEKHKLEEKNSDYDIHIDEFLTMLKDCSSKMCEQQKKIDKLIVENKKLKESAQNIANVVKNDSISIALSFSDNDKDKVRKV